MQKPKNTARRKGDDGMTIELNIAAVVYVATCIGVVGAAVKILAEAKKALTKPLDEINKKMKHHDECLARDSKHLEKIDVAIEELGEATNLLISSNIAMMSHTIYGNHTENLKEEKKQMEDWLVERKDYKI